MSHTDDSPDGSGTASSGTGTTEAELEAADGKPEEIPVWDDEYIEKVSGRLLHNYDLQKDHMVRGEVFSLFGHMELHSEKHFFHPALSFGHHVSHEYLFVRRTATVTERDLESLVDLGHELANDWIEADEEHFSTDFTFVLVTEDIPDDVRSRVAGLDERTLLRLGYFGHYEVNAIVVAPDAKDVVANEAADVEEAFRTWDPIEPEETGLLGLISRRLQL
ncbi:MAG: hypothetical protein ACOCQ3_04690 [Natronomonas sp.]